MSMSFNKVKKELDLILVRLSTCSQDSNNRNAPSDAKDIPNFITLLEGDVMLMEECFREIQVITDRLDSIEAKSTDPQVIAKCEVYACGSASDEGYIKKISDGKIILSSIRVNIASYNKVINAANPAPVISVAPPATVIQSNENFLMPKLKNERFGGDKEGYEFFWNRFKPIHTSTSIDEVDKLYILVGLLDGPAKELLNQYSFVTGNYTLAVQTLKEKYGNKDDVICILLDKFDELKRQSDSIVDCRKCFDQAEIILNQLERMGQDINQRSFQRRWEKYMIAPWLFDACLMKLNANDSFKLFRKEANEVIARKERVGERTNESSTTFCNVTSAKPFNNKKREGGKKGYDRDKPKDPHCWFCKEKHWAPDCKKYSTFSQRSKLFDEQKRCKRCGWKGHATKDCNAIKNKCYLCKSKDHHSALCQESKSSKPKKTSTNVVAVDRRPKCDESAVDEISPASTVTAAASAVTVTAPVKNQEIVLPIVEVPVSHPKIEKFNDVPVLMDSASQLSYITHEYAKKLNLPVVCNELLNIETFNSNEPQYKHTKIYSLLVKFKSGKTEVVFLHGIEHITRKLTMALPDDLENIKFKDVVPSILLGGRYFWNYFKTKESKKLPSGFHLVTTEFGNIVCGEGPKVTVSSVTTLSIQAEILETIRRIEHNVEKQWNFEQAGIFDDPQKTERQIVDEFFEQNISRDDDGRYVVRMPWNSNNPTLKDHRLLCYYRLKSLVTSLKAKGKLYVLMDGLNDHIERGYVEDVTPEMDFKCVLKHYIPYHIVEKPASTTPHRIVFDCSASTGANDPSLNSNLYCGPPKMPDIIGLLIRFRCYEVVVIADVAKAFMQLMLHEDDRDLFRFLMPADPTKDITWDNIRECRYTRPLFGAGPCPLLLEQVITYVLSRITDPVASEILRNLFVDNVLLGADTVPEALNKSQTAKNIFNEMKMNLRDYISNKKEISAAMDTVVPEKTTFLGIPWLPESDKMITVIPTFKDTKKITKRVVLSAVSSIYDPPGMLAPVLLTGRKFIQKLWKKKYQWDSPLDKEDCEWWLKFKELNEGKEIQMLRCIISPDAVSFEAYVFCDASKDGMCAAAYLRQILRNGDILVDLLLGKARVTPIEEKSIPTVELAAVSHGASLIPFLKKQLPVKLDKIDLLTDSTCVIGWLASSCKFGRYIDNRCRHIREHATTVRHVRTAENPADVGSRGCTITELAANKKWWHGPSYLQLPEDKWPEEAVKAVEIKHDHDHYIDSVIEENVEHTVSVAADANKSKIIMPEIEIDATRFSKWIKLITSISAVLFFVQKVYKNTASSFFNKFLKVKFDSHKSPGMITVAENFLIRQLQQKYPPTANLKRSLMLTFDENNIIVCNHRIPSENGSGLIWLPNCFEVNLLIIHIHEKLIHSGPRETLNELRSRFWISQGKRTVMKAINNSCQHCKLLKLKPYQMPAMPVLPTERTQAFAPFLHTGLDFAGPFMVKQGSEIIKNWIILFTCLSTRAVHLETVNGLDSYNFILSFDRFVSRRGRPNLVISDNQSTLKAASKLIVPCWQNKEPELLEYIAKERFTWKFITEKAPWSGGFYERLIGLTKKSLAHAIGKRILTSNEFHTVTVRCEAVVNLRPLTPVDAEYKPNEASQMALRPIDFLLPHGNTNNGILNDYDHSDDDPDFVPKGLNGEELKKLIHKTAAIIGKFWKKWSVEYLNQLKETNQHFHKQHKFTEIIPAVGEVVIIEEENIINNTWKLGIIQELLPSKDNQIRSAKLKTSNGHVLTRALCQLYPLELSIADPNSLQQEKSGKNKTCDQDVRDSENSAGERYPLRNRQKAKNFQTLFVLALCVSLLTFAQADVCKHSSDLQLVYVENCTTNGLAVYKDLDGSFCHEIIDCDSNHLHFGNDSTSFLCSDPCQCPEWSDDCSFYAKNITVEERKEILHLINDEAPHADDTLVHIIELRDGSEHVIRQLNLVKEDILDDIHCFGEGELLNGSPLFCLNHTCVAEAKKYCVINHHQNVYAMVHNGKIPIKAWKSVHTEKPKVEHKTLILLQASCNNGELTVENTKDIRRVQIKSANNYMVVTPGSDKTVIELPTTLVLAERPLEITVWDIFENFNSTTVTCPAVEFCEKLKPCWFCVEELINPHCRPIKSLLFISNIISLAYILIHKCCKWRRNRRTLILPTVVYRKSSVPKRKNSDEFVLPLFRRVPKIATTTFIAVAIICILLPTVVADELSITATNEECHTDAHGFINCTISQITQFSASTLQPSNLLMNFEGRPLGTIRIEPHMNAICSKRTRHFTRIVEIKSTSLKVCPGRKMCSGYSCATSNANTQIKAFGQANLLPGSTYCTESCGGWYCFCLLPGEACLYYRNYALPLDGRVIEVFSCNEWHIVAAINVTITSQRLPPISRILTLHEGHSAEVGKVKIGLLDANVDNTIPPLDQQYIATEKTIAMIDEIGIKAAELVKCENFTVAENFYNCSIDAAACRCLPADGTVSCSCMENNVLLKMLNKNALPVKLHEHWIEPTADRNIIARLNAQPRLQVSVQGLKLRSVIDQNSCTAVFHKLSGCSSCVEGAVATFTCTTDFGNSEAHVICNDSIAFPLKCTQHHGYLQSVNLFFDYSNVDLKCQVKCPSNTGEIVIQGQLHQSVIENTWSVRQAAEAKETSSFIMPIIHALKDFWKASYTLMMVTLVVAAIIAIVVLKILKYFI